MEMKLIANLSKITPPRVPEVLPRPRLIEQIKRNEDKRLLFIMGQAAQGKSTLAAQYVGMQEMPTAWLNLDQGDSDPVNLFYGIINAFQRILPDEDLSSLRTYPSVSIGPRAETPLYREWIEAIFERITFPALLVLDGLDRLAADSPTFRFLQILPHEAPPYLRLIMLSREEPPLGLQELKMKQQAHVLTNDDLAFNPDETRAFFRDIRGLSLNASQAAKVHSFTEGWVGGLLLFSLALERLPETDREKYISEKIPDQFRMDIFRFFGDEILTAQPEEIREVIIKSAILRKIEPEFLTDLTEAQNAEDILHDAGRRNLFVQSVYEEGKGWVFRYHQLFRDFLLVKLNSEFSTETRQSLYLKTGLLFKQKGQLEEAIPFFLRAGAYDAAVSAIAMAGLDLVRSNRTTMLLQWLQALPEKTVQKSPWLLYYLSMTRRFSAPAENLISLRKAFTLFEKAGDVQGCLLSLASLIETTIFRGHDLVPLSVLLAKGEDLLNTLGHDLYLRETAALWLQIGFAFTVRAGNPLKAYRACQNAYLISKASGEIVLQMDASIHAYQALNWLGEYYLAEEKSREIEKLIDKHPYPEMVTFYHIAQIEYYLLKGDLEMTEGLIEFGLKKCERVGFNYLIPIVLVYDVILKSFLGQYREAEKVGQGLLQFAAAIGNLFWTGIAWLWLGRNCYFKGDDEQAKKCFQESYKILSKEEILSPLHLNLLNIWRGLLWKCDDPDVTAVQDMQNSLEYLLDTGMLWVIDANFAMALLFWQLGDRNKAAEHLHSGFVTARERRQRHFTFISIRDLVHVCTLAIELGDREDGDYAAQLLSTRLAPQAEPELERLSKHRDPSIRAKAEEIRHTIHRSNLPHFQIKTLGGFQVIRSDSPLKEEKWHGSQAKNLLKAIIAQREDGIRKEVLMESLWPEGEPDKTEQTFRVALHRLRSILEPAIDKRYGYSYVLLKDNRVSLDKRLIEVDVDRFLDLLQEGEKKEKSRQMNAALAAYQKAADLYKGDFLAGDEYAEWAEPRREELRQKFLNLLFKTARIQEDRGAPRKAVAIYHKAIEFDPLSEEAYRRLMVLYDGLGKRNEAIKTYRACEKALREGIDAEPEALTRSLYKKIENS